MIYGRTGYLLRCSIQDAKTQFQSLHRGMSSSRANSPQATEAEEKGTSVMPRVLILEADAELWTSMARGLEACGLHVTKTSARGETVSYAAEHDTEVVIMSQSLSVVDGLDLLPLLRQVSPARVIVIGDGAPTAVAQALAQGAHGYLQVPVDRQQLADSVLELL